MRSALVLAPRLALARLKDRDGGALLDLFAVLAFTVATTLALTVAGGTSMFVYWEQHGNPGLAENFGDLADLAGPDFTRIYVVLAAIACAMVVVPILSLGGAAARLGARGRASRLASLRLLGMTGSQVVAMSVLETVVLALVGMVLGTLLWLASLPLWSLVKFQTVHIDPTLMRGPWWLWLAVWGVMLILAVLSTILGLRRVRISPLGVAARQTPPSLKVWRAVIFGVALVVAVAVTSSLGEIARTITMGILVVAVMVAVLMLVINLTGPWLLQVAAKTRVKTSSVSSLLAARRIIDEPKAAWRNVSALALVGFIGAFTAMMPSKGLLLEGDIPTRTLLTDLRTGVLVTLGISLVVGAVSTLISQSSNIIDNAEEARTLDRIGVPRSVFSKTRRKQVLLPLIVTLGVSVALGFLMGSPFLGVVEPAGPGLLAAVIAVGIALSLLAAEACRPVLNTVLGQTARRND